MTKNPKDNVLQKIKRSKWPRPIFDKERRNSEVTYFIYPTHKCNLRCTYCYYKEMDAYNLPQMDNKTIKDTINFILNWETSNKIKIHFFGGEPTVGWDVVKKFIKECSIITEKDIKFSMTTNGTLLTPEKLDFIKKNFRNEHPFLLSVDGPPDIQNKNRPLAGGGPSFDTIPYNEIKKRWPLYHIEVRPTFTKEMLVKDAIRCYEWLYRTGFRKIPVEWDYESEWSVEDLYRLKVTVREINTFWYMMVKKGDAASMPKSIKEIEQPFFRDKNVIPQNQACGRGFNTMGVDSQGQIWACQRWAGYTHENVPKDFMLGTVTEGIDLEKMWHIQDIWRTKMYPEKDQSCRNCPVRSTCMGGCNAMNWHKTGDRFNIDSSYCKVRKAVFEASVSWMFSSGYYYEQLQPRMYKKEPKFDMQTRAQKQMQKQGGRSQQISQCVNCFSCQNRF